MSKFAIIGVGGKQYRVTEGDMLATEKLEAAIGSTVKLQHVFLVGHGSEVKVGAPLVAGAHVEATVESTAKGEKVRVFKMKPRKRYRVERGHRQIATTLKITKIHA